MSLETMTLKEITIWYLTSCMVSNLLQQTFMLALLRIPKKRKKEKKKPQCKKNFKELNVYIKCLIIFES